MAALEVKGPPAKAEDIRDAGSISGSGRTPLEEGMATHSRNLSFLPEESYGQRSLLGYSP